MTSMVTARSNPAAEGAELARLRMVAHAMLAACVVVLIVARAIATQYPAFGFLAAFAEAATIGGIADWYAIVALFRRPLGLPIPHTAIIPNSQDRIAEKLGQFIEDTFLAPEPVQARLRKVDFAAQVTKFFSDPDRCPQSATFCLRLLPDIFSGIESSGLKSLLLRSLRTQLYALDATPLVTGALSALIDTDRHQQMLDHLLGMIQHALKQPEMLAQIRDRIRSELPSLLKLYRVDSYLLNKIVASVVAFAEEVRTNPNHPFRAEFDQFVRALIDRLQTDPDFASRINQLKRDIIRRGEIGNLVALTWSKIKSLMDNQPTQGAPLPQRLADLFHEIGKNLASNPAMRANINQTFAEGAGRIVGEHKAAVSIFIADQVKSWDMRHLVKSIEVNVGSDLQYIRFNGMLIGGLVGLALYGFETLLGIR